MNKKRIPKDHLHYTVDDLKYTLGVEHSESVFDIEEEITLQCPRIDSFLEDINLVKDHLLKLNNLISNNINNINKSYIDREISILEKYQDSLGEQFEELRTSCEKLRSWGNSWKHLARNLFDELPNNESFIANKHIKNL